MVVSTEDMWQREPVKAPQPSISDKFHVVVANAMANHAVGELSKLKQEVIQVHLQVMMMAVIGVEMANEDGNGMTIAGVTAGVIGADPGVQAQGAAVVHLLRSVG